MRLVVLTDDADRHYFFANRLIEGTGTVTGVVTGGKFNRRQASPAARLRRLWRQAPAKLAALPARGQMHRLSREKAAAEATHFGGQRDRFEREHPDLRLLHVAPPLTSVNDDAAVAAIVDNRPDVIAVMGTGLVRDGILGAAPLVLNLHTGLSPYYRGGMTNFWPIVDGAFGYFGVTVHVMSAGIDSGHICFTQRLLVDAGDTYGAINCRAIKAGTELMLRAIAEADAGRLAPVPQWSRGKLFHNAHYDGRAARRYFDRRAAFMAEHVRLQAAGGLPELRLVGDVADAAPEAFA